MNRVWYCKWRKSARRASRALLLVAVFVVVSAAPAAAGAPEWLRALAKAPLPAYPPQTEAVMLLDEQVTTVKDNGEITTFYRGAYKILRPQGEGYGTVVVYHDNET